MTMPKISTLLLLLIVFTFYLQLWISIANNGLELEMNVSIDVNHHVWFSNYIVEYGVFPRDWVYEYMPLAMLILPILTLIFGVYSPVHILVRTFIAQLISILVLWSVTSNYSVRSRSVLKLLCLFVIAYPISMAFYPIYFSINYAIVTIIIMLFLMESRIRVKQSTIVFLYTLIFIVALLSQLAYTLIFVSILHGSYLLFSIVIDKKVKEELQRILRLLLISVIAVSYTHLTLPTILRV